jgi:hypothetical protein
MIRFSFRHDRQAENQFAESLALYFGQPIAGIYAVIVDRAFITIEQGRLLRDAGRAPDLANTETSRSKRRRPKYRRSVRPGWCCGLRDDGVRRTAGYRQPPDPED